jgi:hypothetical protein
LDRTRSFLGFDQLERLVERTAKSGNDGYPPYNIEQRGENAYRITLAVAGFARVICRSPWRTAACGARPQSEDDGGACSCIAGSPRASSSAASSWPTGSRWREPSMEHGLLHIDLRRAVPDSVVQTIKINSGGGTS